MIQYFVSDLDGTLMCGRCDVKEKDKEAVIKAVSIGMHLWVATGRGTDSYEMLRSCDIYPEEMICSSGGVLCDASKNVRYISVIEQEDAKRLFTLLDNFKELDYSLDTNRHDVRFVKLDSGNLLRHLPSFPTTGAKRPQELFDYQDIRLMRLFCVSYSNEYCAEVKKAVETEFAGRLRALKTDTNCIDIIPINCGKWNGLHTLLQEKGIDPKNVAAIGDQDTDIEMIEHCGVGFAMSTADKHVQEAADYVVDSVADAIHILLNK